MNEILLSPEALKQDCFFVLHTICRRQIVFDVFAWTWWQMPDIHHQPLINIMNLSQKAKQSQLKSGRGSENTQSHTTQCDLLWFMHSMSKNTFLITAYSLLTSWREMKWKTMESVSARRRASLTSGSGWRLLNFSCSSSHLLQACRSQGGACDRPQTAPPPPPQHGRTSTIACARIKWSTATNTAPFLSLSLFYSS